MTGLAFRYVAWLFLRYVAAVTTILLVIFLVGDFGDRLKAYVAYSWLDVGALYWNKSLVALAQLGPAAVLLAAGATVSTLRKRGELTAMRSLGFAPGALYLPIGVCGLLVAGALGVFTERIATRAGARVDDISVNRFNSWGDYLFFYRAQQWFRIGPRVFLLRGGDVEQGFADVTILELSPEFRLVRRFDAARMDHHSGSRWVLSGMSERVFDDAGQVALVHQASATRDLEVTPASFRIRPGRPEQMPIPELREQIEARRAVGLPSQRLRLALHHRLSYPLTGLAGALLAVGLALRPGRKGHLTVALVEGLLVAVVLWVLLMSSKALVLAERIAPALAAWTPVVVLLAVAAALWLRREGLLGRGGI